MNKVTRINKILNEINDGKKINEESDELAFRKDGYDEYAFDRVQKRYGKVKDAFIAMSELENLLFELNDLGKKEDVDQLPLLGSCKSFKEISELAEKNVDPS